MNKEELLKEIYASIHSVKAVLSPGENVFFTFSIALIITFFTAFCLYMYRDIKIGKGTTRYKVHLGFSAVFSVVVFIVICCILNGRMYNGYADPSTLHLSTDDIVLKSESYTLQTDFKMTEDDIYSKRYGTIEVLAGNHLIEVMVTPQTEYICGDDDTIEVTDYYIDQIVGEMAKYDEITNSDLVKKYKDEPFARVLTKVHYTKHVKDRDVKSTHPGELVESEPDQKGEEHTQVKVETVVTVD